MNFSEAKKLDPKVSPGLSSFPCFERFLSYDGIPPLVPLSVNIIEQCGALSTNSGSIPKSSIVLPVCTSFSGWCGVDLTGAFEQP